MAAALCLAPLCLASSGCLDVGGGIELDLRFPADPALAPQKDEIAHVSLVYWEPGKPTNRVTRALEEVRGGPIDEFSPGQTLRMAVELRTATQRLIGFGRVPEPIEVGADGSASFEVEVRRPFVYLGSNNGIEAIDATQEASAGLSSFLRTIDLAVPAQVAVPTYDGQQLAAVLTRPSVPGDPASPLVSELMVLRTDDHTRSMDTAVPLRAPASDLAISADGRYAIVAHETSADGAVAGGVSIVDLEAAAQGQALVYDLFEGSVGRVSVGVENAGRVFALVNRLDGLDCAGAPGSTVLEIWLGTAPRVQRRVSLGVAAQDLAAADDGSFVVVADSCSSKLWRVPTDGSGPTALREDLENVSSVALWNNNIWAVTSAVAPPVRTEPGGAEIRVVSLDLAGKTVADIPLPAMKLALATEVFSSDGQLATLQVTADGVYAFDLAVAPGAGSIALLMRNRYAVQEDANGSTTFIPDMDVETTEYLLVDVTTTTAVQHVVSQCDIEILGPALIDEWHCAQAQDSQVGSSHVVRGLSVLYGSR
jgi:hypothetical protein